MGLPHKMSTPPGGREDYELDEQLKVFDFSNYPLPLKPKNALRIFYNNINGLEINTAIAAVVNNKKKKIQMNIQTI